MAGKKQFPLAIAFRAIDQVTKPVLRIQRFINGINSRIHDAIGRRLGVLRHKLRRLSEAAGLPILVKRFQAVYGSMRNVAREAANLLKRLTMIGAVAAGITISLIKKFTGAADSIAKVSERLGISTAQLQEWRFAAERAGIPARTLDMALQRFGRRAGEAAAGTGEALGVLEAMGIRLTDATGKTRSTSELLPEVADKLAQVEEANTRNAMAMKLFDSEGVAMVVMLKDGAAGLAEMAAEARKYGGILDQDAIRSAEEFEDQLTNIKFSLFGVGGAILGPILPALTKLIERFRIFINENRGKIEEWAKQFAQALPDRIQAISEALTDLWDWLTKTYEKLEKFTGAVGGAKTIVGVLAAFITAKLMVAIWSLGMSLKALGVTIMATPIGWLLGVIALVVAAIVLLVVKWDWVKEKLAAGWRFLKKAAGATWDWIKEKIKSVTDWVTSKVTAAWQGIGNFFGGIWEGIKRRFNSGVAWIKGKLKAITDLIPDWAKNLVGIETGPSGPPLGGAQGAGLGPQEVRAGGALTVRFDGLPPGARVEHEEDGDIPVGLELGYMMGRPS